MVSGFNSEKIPKRRMKSNKMKIAISEKFTRAGKLSIFMFDRLEIDRGTKSGVRETESRRLRGYPRPGAEGGGRG